MKFSKDGYKRNSKDRNNPYNVIPSGNITMEGVDFPVFGMDNLGNSRVMMPGANYTFPGNSVFEIPLVQNGGAIDIPRSFFRSTERVNDDGSVSTHLMRAEQLDDGTWVGFPSLFENEPGEWYDMSGEEDWMKIYEEAQRRGQVVNFGKDKEAAIAFGEGSWKNPERYEELPVMEKTLPEIEVIGYKSPESKRIGTLSYISDDLLKTTVGKKLQTLPFVDKELLYSEYMNAKKAGLSLDLFNKERKDIIKKLRKSAGITKGELKDLVWDQTADLGFLKRKAARIAYNQLQKGFRYGGGLFKAQDGDEVQEPKFTLTEYNEVITPDEYTNEELFDFLKDKYNTIDTSQQQQDLLEKLRSPIFLDRYKKNWYNITGEELSDEQAINNISQQYEFTSQGAPFHVTFPFVRRNEKGWVRNTTPYINPYLDTGKVQWFSNAKGFFIDPPNFTYKTIENPNIPALAQYSFVPFLNRERIPGWAGDSQGQDVQMFDDWRDTVVHEYAHSYNTEASPLFSPLQLESYNASFNPGRPLDGYDGSGPTLGMQRYRTFISDLFGEDYFDIDKNQYGTWSMQPQEISSIKAETEANLKNEGIWDHTKQKFGMDNLNKMLKKNFYMPDASGYHLSLLGYWDVKNLTGDIKQNKREYDNALNTLEYVGQKPYRIVDYIKNNILEDRNEDGMIIPRTDFILDKKYGRNDQYQGINLDTFNEIFLNSQNDLKERNRYETYDDLLNDYNSGKKRKRERAESILNNIYDGIKTGIDNIYNPRIEEQEIKIEEKKKEILPKMETYFNEIVMDDQGGDGMLARHGKELPKAQDGIFDILQRQQDLRNINSAPSYQEDVFPIPDAPTGEMFDPDFLDNPTPDDYNQTAYDNAVWFATQWMRSPRYKEMLLNSSGTDWWTDAYDVAQDRINNLNALSGDVFYFKDDPNPYWTGDALKGIGGYSVPDTGYIYVNPNSAHYDDSIMDHEVSHSIDRPIVDNVVMDFGKFFLRGIGRNPFLIPEKDVDLMGDLVDKNKTIPENKHVKFWEEYGDTPEEGTRNYYSMPTEVRARINEIRSRLFTEGVDVFNKEITSEDLKRVSKSKPYSGLENIYNDEDILKLINTISQNQDVGDEVVNFDELAKYGKQLPKASPGLEFIKNRYPGFNDLTPDEQNQVLSQYSGNEYIPQTQRPPQFSDDYYRLQEFRQNNPNIFGSTIGLGTLPDYAIKAMSRNPMGQIAIDEDMAKRIERTRGLDPKVAEQFRAMLSGRKSGKTMFVNYNPDDLINSGSYTYDTPGQGLFQSMKGHINQAGINKLIQLSGQMDQPNYPQLQDVDTSFTDKESKRIERENYMDPFGNIDPTSGGMIEIPQIEEEEENPFLVDPQSTITIPKRTVSNIDSLLGNTTDTQLPPKPQAPTVEENVEEEDVYVPQSRRQSDEYIPQSQRRTGGALFQAQDGNEVKFEDLEKGIRYAESLNGELMLNPESTATGLYGQLWSEIKDMYDGTREEFSEDLDYQKKIFKDRANGLIEGVPGLIKNGTDIYNEYSDVEHGMSKLEIAALSNMLGRQGTRKYIGNHIRDGKSLADVFPHLYGDDANQTNKTPIEYIEKFNKGLLGLKLGGEIGKKLRRLKQQLKLYNEGKEISGIVRKELMDRGLIQPVVMQKGGSIEPYTIQQGDYLGKIASDNGLSVDEIVALNPKFKDRRSTIYPGEVVYFDEQSKNAAESNEPVLSYTIQKGDTLGEIASKHRVSLAEVAELNNLTGDQINRIYPGNQLIMPKHAQYIKNESTERQEKIAKSPVTTEDTIVINEFNPINEVWVTRERNEDGTYSTVGGKKQRVDEINLYDNYETIINAKNDGDTSSSTETYTVKQGDTLSSIAGDRDGVTVNSIAYNNNIDNPNNIMVGQKLKIKKSASKPYLVIDKQKGKMHLLYPGEDAPRDSYDILLGTMIGDQATKTVTTYSYNGKELSQDELNEHMKDNGVKTIPELLKVPGYRQASFDQYGGNRMTGAGKYTISAANPDGGRNYRGDSRGALVPSFNLVSDAGIEQALAIHGVTRGRTSNLYDGIGTNNRLTTGCINGKCVDLQSLYDNPDIGEGTEVYILPEEEGSSFVYENGKLNFYTSKENQKRAREGYYKTVKNPKRFEGKGGDKGEFVEGGPGINVTTDFGNYRPIQFEFDIDSYKNSSIPDGNENNLNDEYQQNTKPFLNALAKNKKPLMDLLNIDGDLYNNIALTAFGIYGNESGMGDINDPVEDFFQAARKKLMSEISDTSYGSGSVEGKYRYAYDPSQSVGWTQLRVGYGFTDPRERELLAKADEKFGTNFAIPLNGSNGGYDDVRNHPDYNTLSKEDKEKAENNGYKGGIFLPRDANGMPIKGMSTQYHMYKIDNSELMDQEKSALATMIILTNRYQVQIPVEEKNAPGFDIFNALPLTWRPTGDEETRQNYVNLVNKNMQFVKLIESDIEDFDQNVITKGSFGAYDVPYGFIPVGQKFKRGGEFGLDKQVQFYEDYVNDLYKNTNQEKSADKLYDKLNRMYYNDSKQTGRNTLDTMKAMNEQSNN